MAKREILFNDEVYSIEESVIEASLAEMKSRLVDDYSGSGTTIVYDGTTINVDSAKLATAASHLAATLNRFAGSGANIVVNGVTYGIDSAKLGSAKENMSGTLGEIAGVIEEEDELAGTWVLNYSPAFNITGTFDVDGTFSCLNDSGGLMYSSLDTIELTSVSCVLSSPYVELTRVFANGSYNGYTPMDESFDYDASGVNDSTGLRLRTVEISSLLSEVTNGSTLLTWLQANATKQTTVEPEAPEEPTTDALAGTWVLNDTLTDVYPFPSSNGWVYTLNFTSNNNEYTRFANRPTGTPAKVEQLYYGRQMVYQDGDWLAGNAYKTITITSNLAEVTNGSALLTWLQANATKQGATNLITFTIDGTSYQAESGMTWEQFIDSEYNPDTGYTNRPKKFTIIGTTGVGYAWDEYNTFPVREPNSYYDEVTTNVIKPIEFESYIPSGGGGVN